MPYDINISVAAAEAVARRCSVNKVFWKISQNSQENTCAKVCNFIKKETLTQVFSCEICEIFKNTFFYRTLPVTASTGVISFHHGSFRP